MNKTKNIVRVLSAAMMFIAIVINMSIFSYAETEVKDVGEWREAFKPAETESKDVREWHEAFKPSAETESKDLRVKQTEKIIIAATSATTALTVPVISPVNWFEIYDKGKTIYEYLKEGREKTTPPNPNSSSLMDSIKGFGKFINIKTEIVYSVEGDDDDRTTTIIYGSETDVHKYHPRTFSTKKELHVYIKMTPYNKKDLPKNLGVKAMEVISGKDNYSDLKDLLIPVQVSIDKSKNISIEHVGGLPEKFVDVSEDVNGRVVYKFNIRNAQDTSLELCFISLSQKNNKSKVRLVIEYGNDNNNFVDKVVSDVYEEMSLRFR